MRRDYLNRVWCEAARCAGVASAVEPSLRAMQMQPGVRRHTKARNGARGDAILAMSDGLLVPDVKVVHAPVQMSLTGAPAFGSSVEVDDVAARLIGLTMKTDEDVCCRRRHLCYRRCHYRRRLRCRRAAAADAASALLPLSLPPSLPPLRSARF